jgi:hypothetical protein
MDNGVHRFSQNVRKGQRRPVGTDRMTRMAFSPPTAKPSTVLRERGHEHVVIGMNMIAPCSVIRNSHECGPVNGLIMIDVMQQRGKKAE